MMFVELLLVYITMCARKAEKYVWLSERGGNGHVLEELQIHT